MKEFYIAAKSGAGHWFELLENNWQPAITEFKKEKPLLMNQQDARIRAISIFNDNKWVFGIEVRHINSP